MTPPTRPEARRSSSNRRLLLFLALAVLVPVVLVVGPFRGRFFPPQARAIGALAVAPAPPLERARCLELLGGELLAQLGPEFEAALEQHDHAGLALALERVAPNQATAAVRYLHGIALLEGGHPARALAGLQDAVATASPPLDDEARYALAQVLLLLTRADQARVELTRLSHGASRFAEPARRQLVQLSALE
ncbi:MAG: hypothetical protein JNL90_04510 [Planctomycetes bacterium]|nr:hypothetical protein [Planctomycetota bacterium]